MCLVLAHPTAYWHLYSCGGEGGVQLLISGKLLLLQYNTIQLVSQIIQSATQKPKTPTNIHTPDNELNSGGQRRYKDNIINVKTKLQVYCKRSSSV